LRKKNFGLSENIIKGINYVFKKFNAAIILEDDLLLNKYVLKYLNRNLKKYLYNKKIFSISAYSYFNNLDLKNENQFYKIRRHSSWGWATWKNKWDRVDFYDLNFFKTKNKNFSKLGNDMNLMMWAQNNNLINSWAIRFNFYCSFFNLFSVQPKINMIKNIGNDLSGYHKSFRLNMNEKFDINYDPFRKNLTTNRIINSRVVHKYIKSSHRPSIKLLIKYLIKKIF
tara:strand:+ start:4255 stop:4932 length:678 start_codon:yes stop_codon:yes gene_type:complete